MATLLTTKNQRVTDPKRMPITGSTWKIKLALISLKIRQLIQPKATANLILDRFMAPKKPRISDKQRDFLETANRSWLTVDNTKLATYHWPSEGPKILFAHGWNSKTGDFRRMISAFHSAGFSVFALDAKAHGLSEGRKTAVPEYVNALEEYTRQIGPLDGIIGYSLGGLATGLLIDKLPEHFRPRLFTMIASPSRSYPIFEDLIIRQLQLSKKVLKHMIALAEQKFDADVTELDITLHKDAFQHIEMRLVYDRADQTVLYSEGERMKKEFPKADLVEAVGMGHKRIIADEVVIEYLLKEYSNSLLKKLPQTSQT